MTDLSNNEIQLIRIEWKWRSLFYLTRFFQNWQAQMLAGITTSLAIILDSLAFSFIAGVNPNVGIYTSVCILLLITFLGVRSGMVSASAGSMAVLMTSLVASYGVQYLFADSWSVRCSSMLKRANSV